MKVNKTVLYLFAIVLAVLVVVCIVQNSLMKSAEYDAANEKEKALSNQQSIFNDSIQAHESRFNTLQKKFDTRQESREITKKALTINKIKSNEKIRRIINANDSLVGYLSDSVLRAAGH